MMADAGRSGLVQLGVIEFSSCSEDGDAVRVDSEDCSETRGVSA